MTGQRLPDWWDTVAAAASWWHAAAAAALVVAAVVAVDQVRAWQHRRLASGAQQVRLLAPPLVEPDGAVQMWTTLAAVLRGRWWRRLLFGVPHLAWELRWAGRQLSVVLWVPGTVSARTVAGVAAAAWPAATVTVEPATAPVRTQEFRAGGALLPAFGPHRLLALAHDPDPMRQVVAAGSGLGGGEQACVQVLARPASPRRVAKLRTAAGRLRTSGTTTAGGGWDLASPAGWVPELFGPGRRTTGSGGRSGWSAGPEVAPLVRGAVDKLTGAPHWEVAIRYAVTSSRPVKATASGFAAAFGVFTAGNQLRRVRLPNPARHLAWRRLGRGFLASTGELAAVAQLPVDAAVPGLERARAKAVPAPVAVPSGGRGTKPLGVAEVGGHKIALPVPDARHHMHVLGSTGSGKSTLLANLALADAAAGRGVVVIDPRGDLALDILDRLPADVSDRLVLLDPEQDPPPAFNPLDGEDEDLIVDNIVSVFGRIYQRHWGPRIDDILRSALLTLMRRANAMLTLVPPLLTNRGVRHRLTVDLHDSAGLGGFWEWYESMPPGLRAQMIGGVLARLRALLLRRFVRTVVGVPRSSFDLGRVLDGGILLARLPKGVLGDDTTRLLGSFLVAAVWQAATARARQPEHKRRDATLILDEAQNFLNLPRGIDEICAEARGYHLALVLAHQDLAQLPKETAAAISANARNKVVFACSPEDARVLARHMAPELDEHDLSHLDAWHAATRLVVGGRETAAFTMRTHPPAEAVGETVLLRAACAQATRAVREEADPAIAKLADLDSDDPTRADPDPSPAGGSNPGSGGGNHPGNDPGSPAAGAAADPDGDVSAGGGAS